MLEIVILIYLSRKVGALALKKGVSAGLWKFIFIIGWILFEVIGFIAGIWIFGKDNIISIILLAYMFAITSYVILKAYFSKLPDAVSEDDITGTEND